MNKVVHYVRMNVMKLNLNELDLEKLYHLFDTKEINISIADMLLNAYEAKDVFHQGNIYNQLVKYWNVKEDKKIVDKWVRKSIKEIDYRYFFNNDYYQSVKPLPYKYKDYSLKYDFYEPYQIIPFDEIKVDSKDYKEVTPIAYFPQQVPFLSLSYKNEVWMSITPNEIETMQPAIDRARGNVLVMGLGLGYYPYMISLLKQVKHIYVLEIDKNIIDIFNKCIFPHFPHQNKIHIIHGDAIEYLKDNPIHFDTTFVDIWHNPIDGLPLYLKIKQLEKDHPSNYFYWLEESIIALIRRCLLTLLEESLEGYTDEDYKVSDNPIDEFINKLYFQTKNITIDNYDDIHKMLSNEGIKSLIK